MDSELRRTTDAAWVNSVVNDPAVRDGAGWVEGMDPLDLTEAVENPDNVVLANEHGGFIFVMLDNRDYIFDVHAAFLPEGRGAAVVKAANEALDWIFNNTHSRGVVCNVPAENKHTAWLARRGGMLAYETQPDHTRFAISRALWRTLRETRKH